MYYFQRLKELREANGKTQTQIPEMLKTTQQQYYRYETGKREIPMHHMITFANFYGIFLDYIAGLIETPRKL